MRVAIICLLALLSLSVALGQSPELVEIARRGAFAQLSGADEPTITRLEAVATSALGCRLIDGVPLATAIEVYRLEFPLDGSPFAVHVSADGSMTQACDERFPNLGAGPQPLQRAWQDSDGDGLSDESDACPLVTGLFALERAGCPLPFTGDRDGDGSPDERDRCPDQAGAAVASGCSLMRDEDGDGVPDHVDICPSDAGGAQPDFALGCPADGSGSSTRSRRLDELCLVEGDAPVFASRDEAAEITGELAEAQARALIGRTAAADWAQLAGGWVKTGGLRLRGACYNIPLVNPIAGGATGCFLRPQSGFAVVHQAPAGRQVSRLTSNKSQAALGQSFDAAWLFYRAGWVNRASLELSGNCDRLPVLDPAQVASGLIHFCPPNYAGYLPPRIGIGKATARIASPTAANRLRAAPDISARQIGEIPPGSLIDALLDGPACKEARLWWQVDFEGQVGWTVESDLNFNYYYLEPVAGAGPSGDPALRAPSRQEQGAAGRLIHIGNAASVDTVKRLSLKSASAIAWSPGGDMLATIHGDGDITVFQPAAGWRRITLDRRLGSSATAIAFSPDGRQLALGQADGGLKLVEITSDDAASHSFSLNPMPGSIRAIAWSRAGDKLAAVSGDDSQKLARRSGALWLWALNPSSPVERELSLRYRFPYPLTAVALSADDQLLAVTGESPADGRAGLWVYRLADGELLHSKALIPMGGARVVASPDAALGDFVYNSGDSLYQLAVESGDDRRLYHLAGALLPRFSFRRQVLPGAEALLAVASDGRNGETRLHIVNALNSYSPSAALRVAPTDLAFSPDGFALALAEPDGALILGVVDG